MKTLFTFLLSFVVLISFGQPRGLGKSDPAAKKVLDAVSAKFKTYKSVQANFVLKVENAAGKLIANKAGSVFMKGSKYRINFPAEEIYSDGSNVWTYDIPSKEVTITKLDPSANSLTPQKLFTNFYDKDFLYKLNAPVKMAGKTVQELELTPIDKTKPFHKVLVYVLDNNIVSTKIFEKTGNRFTYTTSALKPNLAVADATFVYDTKKHPGVEVVDLR